MNDAELYRKFEEYFTDHGLTFDQAAEMIDVSRSSLFNWKNGKSISKRARVAMRALIAEPENSTPQKRPGDCSYDVPAPVFVPLLTVAQAASVQASAFGPAAQNIEEGSQSGFMNPKPGDFAIVVSGRSMLPWYPPGTHILVGRDEIPKTGDRVVAMLEGNSEPVFKVFVDHGDTFELLSINSRDGLPPIRLNKMDRTEWYWCWPIKESKRNERDLDAAMKEFGIHHFWEDRVKEAMKKEERK